MATTVALTNPMALTNPTVQAAPQASAPGTPVLTVDTELVRQRYLVLCGALPGVQLHYAVKANPAPAVLTTLLELGSQWDVASPGEIDAVLEIGGEPRQMSYGNTIKKAADISYAAAQGLRRFTVDSAPELAKIIALAPRATVLVRLATSGAGADLALGSKSGCPERKPGTCSRWRTTPASRSAWPSMSGANSAGRMPGTLRWPRRRDCGPACAPRAATWR